MLDSIYHIVIHFISTNNTAMGRYYIPLPNGKRKYVKTLDYANQKLEFTENGNEAHTRDDGEFYLKTECEFLKTQFSDIYPECKDMCWTWYNKDDDEIRRRDW